MAERLSKRSAIGYIWRMSESPANDLVSTSAWRGPILVVIAIAGIGGLVATLAGWSAHGTAILFTYAEAGMAWCF